MKQLTPLDSSFYYFETPNQPMMIGSLWLCDQSAAPNGVVRHKEILQYIGDRLCTTSLFRRRLQHAPFALDEPYWLEDENFDLEYHVRHVGLPQPGDWRQLCIFTARTMSRSIDMDRAPWEIYIIEGVNNVEGVPPGSFAVLIRFHHAYVDGKSSFELSTAMMEDTPHHEYGRRDQVQYVERAPTEAEMWLRTAPRLIGQSLRALRAGFEYTAKSLELAARLQGEGKPEQLTVPHTIFNTTVTPHRSYGAYSWSLRELKRTRQLVPGATVNDVVISILAGAMRRYLIGRHALPAEDSLVSMCPVAMRPDDAKKEGGNVISAMYIPIGTDIEDPVARLEAVRRRTAQGVPLAKEVLCDLNNAAGEMIPPYVRAMLAWAESKTRLASKFPLFNTVITNVPGIPGDVPRYFAGAKIVRVSPLVPVSDVCALSHGITGIYDDLNVGVLADRAVVPDMDVYIRCIEASTQEYLEQTQRHDAAPEATEDKPQAQPKVAKPVEAIRPNPRPKPKSKPTAKPQAAPTPRAAATSKGKEPTAVKPEAAAGKAGGEAAA